MRQLIYEVWVSNESLKQMVENHDYPEASFRFNARFSTFARAADEVAWYRKHGYDAEVRDDRGERLDVDDDYVTDGVLEYPEGSGG